MHIFPLDMAGHRTSVPTNRILKAIRLQENRKVFGGFEPSGVLIIHCNTPKRISPYRNGVV